MNNSRFLYLGFDGTRIALSVQLMQYCVPTISPFSGEPVPWTQGWPDRGRLKDLIHAYYCEVCSIDNPCMMSANRENPEHCVAGRSPPAWVVGLPPE